jgi:hypothetical protein
MARRAEGVSPLSPADLEGSRGADGRGVNLPKATYENPGPTANLRGIEANTNWGWDSTGEPMIQVMVGGEMPVSAVLSPPFTAPYDAQKDTVGPGDPGWEGADSSSQNVHSLIIPQDSFSAMGETYPANGGLDGAS